MPKTILSNHVYDVLKWVAIIALPAFSIFYARIGEVWGFPYTQEICDTLDASAVLLGALLCVSAIQYQTGKAEEGQKSDDSAEKTGEADKLIDPDTDNPEKWIL